MRRFVILLSLTILLFCGTTALAQGMFDLKTMKYSNGGVQQELKPATERLAWLGVENLFGTEVENDNLLLIDKNTAGNTVIGPTATSTLAALAIDHATGIIYGTDTTTDNLLTVDPETGATTVIGTMSIGLPHGAAIDPMTGILYVCDSVNNSLYRVDKETAESELIGVTGCESLNALDFDPVTCVLYGAKGGQFEDGALYTIDTETAASSLVGPTHRINGLSFDEFGTLYASENGLYVGIPSSLYLIDKTSGAWTLIGSLEQPNVLGILFDSLGVTPVRNKTWSEVKTRFGNAR